MIQKNSPFWLDGTALTYHAVVGTALDLSTLIFSITVGSWPSPEHVTGPPYQQTMLQVRYSQWLAAHAESADATVQNHPDWTGAEPSRPSPYHLFDMDTQAWVDPRTLQDLKDAKWLEVKRARNAAELGPFAYNGMAFDGDLNAQRRLAAYISVSKSALAASQDFSAEFTLANNTQVTLSALDFVGIELAKVQAVAAAFARATALRAQSEAAQTPADLDAITW